MSENPITFHLSWKLPLPSGATLFVKYDGASPPADADKIERYMAIIKDTILCVQQEAAITQSESEAPKHFMLVTPSPEQENEDV